MNTLHFFTEYYQPAYNSTSFYMSRIIHSCAEVWKGPLRVYCASQTKSEEELQGEQITITRFKGGRINKNSLPLRVLKFLLITLKFAWAAALHVKKNDTLFAVTNPAFLLVFLAVLRKFRKFRFILLVYDIFPEVLIPGGLTSEKSAKYKFMLKVFNWAYNKADTLVVIGRDMQKVVEKKVKDPSRICFIPNWSDTENITSEPKEQNPILKKYGIADKFIFSVAGNMGRTQGLENIVKALSMNCLNENTRFLFMGNGAKKELIRKQVESLGLKQVIITGWIPQAEQNDMLTACDVAVISLAEGMFGLSVPSKSYFNMAAGKPLLLIGDPDSEIAQVIRENDIGWCVEPGKPELLAEQLKKISEISPNLLAKKGLDAKLTAERFYREQLILEKYQQLVCKEPLR